MVVYFALPQCRWVQISSLGIPPQRVKAVPRPGGAWTGAAGLVLALIYGRRIKRADRLIKQEVSELRTRRVDRWYFPPLKPQNGDKMLPFSPLLAHCGADFSTFREPSIVKFRVLTLPSSPKEPTSGVHKDLPLVVLRSIPIKYISKSLSQFL